MSEFLNFLLAALGVFLLTLWARKIAYSGRRWSAWSDHLWAASHGICALVCFWFVDWPWA